MIKPAKNGNRVLSSGNINPVWGLLIKHQWRATAKLEENGDFAI